MEMIELVIKIPKETYEKAKKGAFNCTVINKAILDGVFITERQEANNGDMIKAMFDVQTVDDFTCTIGVKMNKSNYVQFNKSWWNAPYKKGGTEE